MSYTKQTWATGDTVTADKLNHMEDGIEGAGGGGGGFDVVISCDDNFFINNDTSYYTLASGSYSDICDKIHNNEPINGIAISCADYNDVGHNDIYNPLYLTRIETYEYDGYVTMTFSSIITPLMTGQLIGSLYSQRLRITLDDNDAITAVEYGYANKTLS